MTFNTTISYLSEGYAISIWLVQVPGSVGKPVSAGNKTLTIRLELWTFWMN